MAKGKISNIRWEFQYDGGEQWTTRIVVNNNHSLCQNVGISAKKGCARDLPIEENIEYNITSPAQVQDSVQSDNVTVVLSIFVDDYVLENLSSVFCRIFRFNELHDSKHTFLQLELSQSQTTTTQSEDIQSSLPLTTDYNSNTSTPNAGRRSCVHLCHVTLLVLLQTYLWQSMLGGG